MTFMLAGIFRSRFFVQLCFPFAAEPEGYHTAFHSVKDAAGRTSNQMDLSQIEIHPILKHDLEESYY